jgi:microcystin degradation protein MlrC
MRIAICGILSENNTFTLDSCDTSLFTVLRGDELLATYEWSRLGDDVAGVEWVPLLRAQATAAGEMRAEDWDAWSAEIHDGLRAAVASGPLDGVYLDLHGAVKVAGRDGAEESFVRAVRDIVGPSTVLSASMDPHGAMSRELAGLVDLATSFRHAPHIDVRDTRDRAVRNLVATVRAGIRPAKAWVRVPILLPGERTSTLVEPGASVFPHAAVVASHPHVVDAAVWLAFAWADEPRNAGAVLVTADDEQTARAAAAELADRFWAARDDFAIVAPRTGDVDSALDAATDGSPLPLWISDSGDNTTAGGSGDLTVVLDRVLARPELRDRRVLIAPLVDAAAVAAAAAAGLGATLDVAIGAGVDNRYAPPVRGPWTVTRVVDGSYDGEGVVAAHLERDGVTVLVQAQRSKFTPLDDATIRGRKMPGNAWFEPDGYDVVVVKNGYLFPAQTERAATWVMAITPGGTDLDPDRLGFSRVERPLFPFDRGFEPDLTPVLLSTVSTDTTEGASR